MPRIQLKIMAALALLVFFVVMLTGLFAERGLRQEIVNNLTTSLIDQAQLTRELLQNMPIAEADRERLHSAVARAAVATNTRVTVIDAGGVVIADSGLNPIEIARMDNHALRPEVATAMQGHPSHSIRWSNTLKTDLLYVALPFSSELENTSLGTIRLAVDLERVDQAVARLRTRLLTAATVGLVAALALSYVLSWLSLRPVRELAEAVGNMADGRPGPPLAWRTRDERAEIALSIDRMTQRERDRLTSAQQEKGQLQAVLGSMVEGVLAVDSQSDILLANPRLREMFSIWGDVVGKPVSEVIHVREIDAALRDARLAQEILVRDVRLEKPTERVLLMHVVRFPRTGPRSGTVIVFHDVSEMRRVDEIRRDFIANASHELRTPLTAIQGFADTLASEGTDHSQTRNYLSIISRNAQRMSELLDDLLTLSRIESGQEEWKPISLNVGRVVAMLLQDFQPQFERAGLTARLRNEDSASLVRVDPNALEQILTNLLTNSVRYSNEGGHIEVRITSEDDNVLVSVEDTGIGIADEHLERIFERFYRVDKARSRALGSTGLGLAIVRHLATAMGGEIRVESELGAGSRFIVSLPVADP